MTDRGFLLHALQNARYSLDPNTKVGCVLGASHYVINGHNHLPFVLSDKAEIMADRDLKLRAIVHAEMDVLCKAARHQCGTVGATLYTAATDDTGVWGGPPCTNCCKHIIQAGISRIVTFERKSGFSKWKEDLDLSETWLEQAGIELNYLAYIQE